jgi:hypothetical protein
MRVKIIMRLMFTITAIAAALCLDISASKASGYAPWCSVVSIGNGTVIWDCRYRTVEECSPNVIAGNRGFCNPNPWYEPRTIAPGKHRKRHHD